MVIIRKSRGIQYRPLSADSLITQLILLNIVDSLLTLYATKAGVSELNPIMEELLSAGPHTFFAVKVLSVTALAILINRPLGRFRIPVFMFLSTVYWLVLAWHLFGVLCLYGVV